MDDQWGPWIEHDGKGCPKIPDGTLIQAVWLCDVSGSRYCKGETGITEGVMRDTIRQHPAWDWSLIGQVTEHPRSGKRGRLDGRFVRYRTLKPRGLSILQEIAANPQRELERTE